MCVPEQRLEVATRVFVNVGRRGEDGSRTGVSCESAFDLNVRVLVNMKIFFFFLQSKEDFR